MNVRVIIEYIPSDHGSINYNNIEAPAQSSLSDLSEISTAHVGARPFLVGASIVGAGDTLWAREEKYNGFIGSQRNVDGVFNPPPIFRIVGQDIDHLVINFDSTAQQWATEMIINGRTYKNSDASFLWANPAPIDSVEIRITKWNKPLFPVRITSILIGLTIEYDYSQLKNLTATNETTRDINSYSTGTMSQYASFSLLDYDLNILELAQLKLLKSGLKTIIYFDDKKIAEMEVDKVSYPYGSQTASFTLKDTILKWDNIFFPGIENNENNTAETFFNRIVEIAGEPIEISSNDRQVLRDISLPDGYLSFGNLRERMDEFLGVVGMKLYKEIVLKGVLV